MLQSTRPWISTKDIPGGSIWFTEISEQLANSTTGIICLTKENFRNEWILFESGALFKGLPSSRLHTVLIDLSPSDIVDSPLTQLNHTKADKEGIRKLVHDINRQLDGYGLQSETLEQVFDTYWPQFERLYSKAMSVASDEAAESANKRSVEEMLQEVLARLTQPKPESVDSMKSEWARMMPDSFLRSTMEWIHDSHLKLERNDLSEAELESIVTHSDVVLMRLAVVPNSPTIKGLIAKTDAIRRLANTMLAELLL